MDCVTYQDYQREQFEEYEGVCKRCGLCCGALNDPCVHLAKEEGSGRYYCLIYEKRLGMHKTVSGKDFHCVTIRENMRMGALDPHCAYNSVFGHR